MAYPRLRNLHARLRAVENGLIDEVTLRNEALSTAIATEVANRHSAISAAIATEVADRDLAIAEAIATEVEDRDAAIAEAIAEAIDTEVANRGTAISGAIATEVANRNAAIAQAISTEIAQRNTAISEAIATEVANRNAAIAQARAAEVQARDAAISALFRYKLSINPAGGVRLTPRNYTATSFAAPLENGTWNNINCIRCHTDGAVAVHIAIQSTNSNAESVVRLLHNGVQVYYKAVCDKASDEVVQRTVVAGDVLQIQRLGWYSYGSYQKVNAAEFMGNPLLLVPGGSVSVYRLSDPSLLVSDVTPPPVGTYTEG